MINTKKTFTHTPTLRLNNLATSKVKLVCGFTLIELIMVVAIISLLTSIVLSSLTTARQKGEDATRVQAVHEVQSALQLYLTANNGSYPGGDQTTLASFLSDGTQKYIGSIDPRIIYKGTDIDNNTCLSNCASYHIGISLERLDNPALKTDKDMITGIFDGTKDDCSSTGPTSIPDKCFDVTP